ncbi:hypothetical protein GW17_00059271 [Ensete ventricosum]|nr:hypothetical protein GW17_00059271 [Ensete ventricosum]RZS25925.1 hypothetical protein BHM03_00059199 [Ensete ventricosum]
MQPCPRATAHADSTKLRILYAIEGRGKRRLTVSSWRTVNGDGGVVIVGVDDGGMRVRSPELAQLMKQQLVVWMRPVFKCAEQAFAGPGPCALGRPLRNHFGTEWSSSG